MVWYVVPEHQFVFSIGGFVGCALAAFEMGRFWG